MMECFVCPVCFAALERRKGIQEGKGFCPDCMDVHPLKTKISRVVSRNEDTSRWISAGRA